MVTYMPCFLSVYGIVLSSYRWPA